MNQSTKLTLKTFLILLFGFFILLASFFFIMTSYWRLNHEQISASMLSGEIHRLVKLVKTIPANKVRQAQKLLPHRGVWTTVSHTPPKNFKMIKLVKPKAIDDAIAENPTQVQLSFPISDSLYLNVQSRLMQPFYLTLQFYAALFVWLAALISFCYYIVRQLSLPLAYFTAGANRFAQDLNAPPISEIGPKPTRLAFQAFNRMQFKLKQMIQSRTQMLAAISHDLRTPITRLKLRLENMPPSETANKMNKDLDRMEMMIQSILNFSQDEFQYEAVVNIDLVSLCQSICDDLQDMQFAVTLIETNQKLICLGRTLALRRALTNLIVNGVKYGKQVEVELVKDNNQVKISICDQGEGIPDSELEQVFLPFYRVDKARQDNTGGSGLGLTVARDIIRSHGGDIVLQNLPTHGLCATVHLPLSDIKKT